MYTMCRAIIKQLRNEKRIINEYVISDNLTGGKELLKPGEN